MKSFGALRRGVSFVAAAFVFFAAVNASALSDADIRSLKLTSHGETFFVGQDVLFTLELPGVDPSLARAEVPDFSLAQVDAKFVSSKKTEIFSATGDTGTRFEVQIAFSAAGNMTLPPLTVYINRRAYAVPFEAVTVYEDPATIQPQVFVVFSDDRLRGAQPTAPLYVSVGEAVRFTLYIRYCVQLLHFSWELPKNAIFTETERYAIARGETQTKTFSADAIPVAQFAWTPLVAGEYAFPQFSIEASAYNGTRTNPATPAYRLFVQPTSDAGKRTFGDGRNDPANAQHLSGGEHRQTDLSDSPFANAFTPAQPATDSVQASVDEAKATDDAAQAGTPSSQHDALASSGRWRASLPRTLLVLSVLSALLAVGSRMLRHKRAVPVLLALAIVFLIASLFLHMRGIARYALFAGGAVYAVPEDASSSAGQLPAGTRITIVEKAGDWVYITSDRGAGWVRSDTVQEIR